MTSQRLLAEALTRIVREEGFNGATVTRVAREAGLSRSGFYEHFANVDELSLFVLDNLLAEISALDLRARIAPGADGRAIAEFALELVLESILENQDLYRHILLSDHASGVLNRILDRFAEGVRPVVEIAQPGRPAAQIDLLAAAIGGAILGAVRQCLRAEEQRTAYELAHELIDIMPPWLYPAHINNPETERSAEQAAATADHDSDQESSPIT